MQEAHFVSRTHLKRRDELGIKEIEDLTLSKLVFTCEPGDITQELKKEKEKALKRKVKRIKLQLQHNSVTHENASTQTVKLLTSQNQKRLKIRCIELEKSVFPIIQNYQLVEDILCDLIRVLEKKNPADLHLMRKLKYIPTLVEICKRISLCTKT